LVSKKPFLNKFIIFSIINFHKISMEMLNNISYPICGVFIMEKKPKLQSTVINEQRDKI
jgi:hypothetical protein